MQRMQKRSDAKKRNIKDVDQMKCLKNIVRLYSAGSKLEIQVILWLLPLWSTKTPVGKEQDELQVRTQYQDELQVSTQYPKIMFNRPRI